MGNHIGCCETRDVGEIGEEQQNIIEELVWDD